MKSIFKQILFVVLISLISLFLFGIFRTFFGKEIIFYEGLAFAAVFFPSVGILFLFFQWVFPTKQSPVLVLSVLPAALFFVLFISIVPTIIDRSVSITVLGKLRESGAQGASMEELKQHFEILYVEQGNPVQIRINEQIASGNVVDDNGVFKLTARGRYVLNLFNWIGGFYRVNLSYLNATESKNELEKNKNG